MKNGLNDPDCMGDEKIIRRLRREANRKKERKQFKQKKWWHIPEEEIEDGDELGDSTKLQ